MLQGRGAWRHANGGSGERAKEGFRADDLRIEGERPELEPAEERAHPYVPRFAKAAHKRDGELAVVVEEDRVAARRRLPALRIDPLGPGEREARWLRPDVEQRRSLPFAQLAKELEG